MSIEIIFAIGGLMALSLIFLMTMFARLYRKAGPHEALVVYGFRGTRIIKGRGSVIFPMVENCKLLSLELMSFDVAPQQDLYTKQGVAVTVEAVAQIKVKSDPESIQTASEQFLTKTPPEREGLIRLVMEGHLRGIIGQLTVEEIVKQPEMVGDRMRATCADDLHKMGLEVISFTIKEVRDKNEYITNMGRPDVARIKRDADVAAAEAERDTAIKRAEAMRAAAVAKAQADKERVLAETISQAAQAEAQRDLQLKQAAFLESVQKQKASADKAYEIQTNVMQQQVMAEQVKIEQVQKTGQIAVQEAEIQRREKRADRHGAEASGNRTAQNRDARRSTKTKIDVGGRRPGRIHARHRRSGSRNHFQERRSGSESDERQSGSLPGIQPGCGDRQADRQHAGNRQGARLTAGERRQNHGRFDG
jgi:flotillin